MDRTRIATAIASALIALGPAGARAQEDDAATPPAERWGAEIGFALNSATGNEKLTILTSELGITRLETRAYELDFKGRFRYGRSEGEEVARNLRLSLSLNLWPGGDWSPFVFTTTEQDPFRKLDIRADGGAGVKRTFYAKGWDEVSLSGAVLYSYERVEIVDPIGNALTRTARLSWRGRARHEFREGTRLEQVVFYQPASNTASDYLVEAQTTGRMALTHTLAFTANLLFQRDSTPAPGVEPDDLSLSLGLSLAATW